MEKVQETFQYFLNEINKLSESGHNHLELYLFKDNNKSINSNIFDDIFESINIKDNILASLLFIIIFFASMILFLTDEIINLLTFGNLTISAIFLSRKKQSLNKSI